MMSSKSCFSGKYAHIHPGCTNPKDYKHLYDLKQRCNIVWENQGLEAGAVSSESIATIPPFGPIEGQKWFVQISSQ